MLFTFVCRSPRPRLSLSYSTARALELFLKDIILQTTTIAREQNTKKIQPCHLKRLANVNRTYDFLDDVLAKFVDPTGGVVSGGAGSGSGNAAGASTGGGATTKGKSRAKPAELESDEEEEEEEDEDEGGSDEAGVGAAGTGSG